MSDELFHILSKFDLDDQKEIILYCGPIERPHDDLLIKRYCGKKKKNILLLLATAGGDANAAYRIAQCLKNHFESFSVFIHTYCKSAGTLLALGANELIMSDYAELGPLDVQLRKADEVGEMTSGLTISQALDSLQNNAFSMFEEYFLNLRVRSGGQITTMKAMDVAANLTVGLYAPIYGQIDPLRMGEIHRAIMISMRYGERIGKENLQDKALERLVSGYPDHGFVIDRTECKELFKNVRPPNENEEALANCLHNLMIARINEEKPTILYLTEYYFTEKGKKDESHRQGNNEEAGCNTAGEHTEECISNKKTDEAIE